MTWLSLLLVLAASPTGSTPLQLLIAFQPLWMLLLTGLFAWGQWSLRRATPTREEHDKVKARVVSAENAIRSIRRQLDELPTHKDLSKIELGLEALAGEVNVSNARSERTERMVERIHEHLLQGSAR